MFSINPYIPEIIIIWGCQLRFQYERDWILELLKPSWFVEYDWTVKIEPIEIHKEAKVYLIESGIHMLRDSITEEELQKVSSSREQRINSLSNAKNVCIIHLSDEEGIDGDYLYKKIARPIEIWRNFYQIRFDIFPNIRNFALGPTRTSLALQPWVKASERSHIWNFIGTNWKGTEREEALKQFKAFEIGKSFLYSGEEFGRGLENNTYKNKLLDSIFTLCPKGARHWETFRFYESLEAGSIPLTINSEIDMLKTFHTPNHPFITLKDWEDAELFMKEKSSDRVFIDNLQNESFFWWLNEKDSISKAIVKKNSN